MTEDALEIRSDPGVGIVKAGWACGAPPQPTGDPHDCGDCKKCVDGACVNDDRPIPGEACKACQGGKVANVPDGDKATDGVSCCYEGVTQQNHPIVDLNKCPKRTSKAGHVPRSNGCGGEGWGRDVPDNPMNFVHMFDEKYLGQYGAYYIGNFKPPCDFHDKCYDTCNEIKVVCDLDFWDRMIGVCVNSYSNEQIYIEECLGWADRYLWGVKNFGGTEYKNAQRNACGCCFE